MTQTQREAITCLKGYQATKSAEIGMREELLAMDSYIKALEACGTEPEDGEEDGERDELRSEKYRASLIERRNALRARLLCVIARRRAIERGLNALSEKERQVLEVFFIVKPEKEHSLDVLMDCLGYEKTHIYRIRAAALRKFSERMYGNLAE